MMADDDRLITIEEFVIGMLGFKSRISYYNHLKEPGWPMRVYIGNRPMLRFSDCQTYIKGLVPTTDTPSTKTPPPKKRRRLGRPVKPPARAAV